MVTETWLSDGDSMEEDVSNFVLGTGIGMIYRNREANDRGISYGGVAIVFKSDAVDMRKMDHPNPSNYEVLAGVCTLPGHARRLVVIGCYMPPGYPVTRGRACLDYITDMILEMRIK